MRILRLASKSQRSCFRREVSSAYRSELGNTLNFQLKCFALFGLFSPARAPLHVLYYPRQTLTCLPLPHLLSHLARFPPLLPSFSLFATMVCAYLSLYGKRGNTALVLASKGGHTAIVELLLGAGADTDAKNKVRVTKRKKSTHAHTHVVDKMV